MHFTVKTTFFVNWDNNFKPLWLFFSSLLVIAQTALLAAQQTHLQLQQFLPFANNLLQLQPPLQYHAVSPCSLLWCL
jgi:hypothetical protein